MEAIITKLFNLILYFINRKVLQKSFVLFIITILVAVNTALSAQDITVSGKISGSEGICYT